MTIYILTTYSKYDADVSYFATTNKKMVSWWCKNVYCGSYQEFEVKNHFDFLDSFGAVTVPNKIKRLAEAQNSGIKVQNIPNRYKEKFESFLDENKYSVGGTLLKRFYCSHCGFEDFNKRFAYVAAYANGSTYRCPQCREESSNVEEEDSYE